MASTIVSLCLHSKLRSITLLATKVHVALRTYIVLNVDE